jgi:hypothetical protein
LRLLGIGRCREKRAWAFPARDGERQLIGIAIRSDSGKKYMVPGSKQGLFIPADREKYNQLLICEGASDTAAALDLGFDAVGRPNCRLGTEMLVALCGRYQPRRVAIVADRDPPRTDGHSQGEDGARELADRLAQIHIDVRVILPPAPIKDLRAWKVAGANREAVLAAIDAAPQWRPSGPRA